jgi:hypothetical protein
LSVVGLLITDEVQKTGYEKEKGSKKGSPETSEKSIIVRSVSADRPTGSSDDAAAESDRRVWELGISIEGTYQKFQPDNADELNNILKTSGLGLSLEKDVLTFFRFMPPETHCPESQTVSELLTSWQNSDDISEPAFTHVLLTTPEDNGTRGMSYSEFAEAGGRFLVDLERPGSVKMEAVTFHPLAVRPAASVAVVSGNTLEMISRKVVVMFVKDESESKLRVECLLQGVTSESFV